MFLTNTANYLTERILLAESITDNLAELQQLEKVAEPGFLKSYLDDLVPHLVNFAFRAVLAVLIYFIGRKIMETTYIVAVLGSAGLALGLALQGSLSNFAGGVLILLFKPFKVGDYIMEDTHGNEGTVAEIMIFYTKLSTPDNRTVVIPNGTLANASLTNVTQQDRRRVDVYVGVSYDTDIRRAKKLLSEILLSEPSRMEEEDWQVFVDELGDSSVRLGCRLWVAAADYWQVKWRLNERIKEVFDENQIEIPYNHLTVELKQ